MVSTGQYILQDTSSILHTKVNSNSSKIFYVGCIFVDHASGYMIIKHQVTINTTETVKDKLTFEQEDQSQVVVIKGYQTDNGIFNYS